MLTESQLLFVTKGAFKWEVSLKTVEVPADERCGGMCVCLRHSKYKKNPNKKQDVCWHFPAHHPVRIQGTLHLLNHFFFFFK